MLDALRKGAGTWIAKLFIALLIFSFAIWGVTDFLQGFGQNTAAKVGDTEITLLDFERTYRQDLNRLAQQFGRPLTNQEGAALGVPQQALGRLIAEAALNNTAQELKLGVSDARLAKIIQADPAFKGLNGRYDRNRLEQVLRNNSYQEDAYVIQRRRVAERNQLVQGLAGDLSAPETYLKVLNEYQSEARSVDYLMVTADTIGPIEDPSADVLTAYYDGKKDSFRAPEYREMKYIELTPDTLARPQDIEEADARAEYEQRANDFHQPERRKIRQMSFPSKNEAEKAATELQDGKTFDDLMKERNLTNNDVNLGVMSKTDFLDEKLGDTAFGLDASASSGAVDGKFSTVILNVEEILPESTKPFEEVKDQIVQELAREQAEREILDLMDEIEDARAGGALLDEIGQRFDLKVITVAPFDKDGKLEDGTGADLPKAEGLVAGTFDSDVGIENDVLQMGDQGFLWYEVEKVIPSRERALDEVRDDVIAAWKAEELTKRLGDKATDLLTKLESGSPMATVATDAGLEVLTAQKLMRNRPNADFGADALAAVFSGPAGTNALATSADGAKRIVLTVSDISRPDFNPSAPEMTVLDTQLSDQMRDSLIGQFITDQEDAAGVEINQAGISQIIGLAQN